MDEPDLREVPALDQPRCSGCGSLAEELYGRETRTWFIRCPVCGRRTGPHLTQEKALTAWAAMERYAEEVRATCANGQS